LPLSALVISSIFNSKRKQAGNARYTSTYQIKLTHCFHRLVEIRAAQRTFEGAYIRTALGQFSFALVVLKIFTAEFYSIGALFATYGVGVLMVSLYRRYEGNRQFFSEVGEDGLGRKKFRTSGNAVVVLTALSVAAYASLIVLTARLES